MRGPLSPGDKYGRLTMLEYIEKLKGWRFSRFHCECGRQVVLREVSVKSGVTKSCGCFRKEQASIRATTHGMTKGGVKSRTYNTWKNMRRRCEDPTSAYFVHYGGRGISVCERWHSYVSFLEDMGECPIGLSIERENNDGNYEPGNCRWATAVEQANNTRRNVFFEYKGHRKTISQWAKDTGINVITLWCRLNQAGMSIEQALTVPVGTVRWPKSN